MKLNELTIKEYTHLLESKKSIPGGGSALGLVLELACSLGLMVCNFTLEKKGYEIYREEIILSMSSLEEIKIKAHEIIDEDGKAYQQVMDAYKSRDLTLISEASIYGCEVPYQLFHLTKKCEQICSRLLVSGNKNLISDAKIAIDLCKAIYEGCLDNIRCNVNQINSEIKEKYLELIK